MRIDFAVIATLDEEFDAVKRIFQLQEKDLKFEKNFLYYYKKIGDCGVAFFKFTSQGNLNSSSQTTQIIQNFNPRFIKSLLVYPIQSNLSKSIAYLEPSVL